MTAAGNSTVAAIAATPDDLTGAIGGNAVAAVAFVMSIVIFTVGHRQRHASSRNAFLAMFAIWTLFNSVMTAVSAFNSFAWLGLGGLFGLVPVFIVYRTAAINPRFFIQIVLCGATFIVVAFLLRTPDAKHFVFLAVFFVFVSFITLTAGSIISGLNVVALSLSTAFMIVYCVWHFFVDLEWSTSALSALHTDVAAVWTSDVSYQTFQRMCMIMGGALMRCVLVAYYSYRQQKTKKERRAVVDRLRKAEKEKKEEKAAAPVSAPAPAAPVEDVSSSSSDADTDTDTDMDSAANSEDEDDEEEKTVVVENAKASHVSV